jgi:dATP pyrophosphohydrolase
MGMDFFSFQIARQLSGSLDKAPKICYYIVNPIVARRHLCFRVFEISQTGRTFSVRAPFQILAIPYRILDGNPIYCIFHRADLDQWQFIAGGEDLELPFEAAKREAREESGIESDCWIPLESLCHIPITVISERARRHWDPDIYVIPEYSFGFLCTGEIRLSREHAECLWLPYEDAMKRLQWDSNRTALYELNCRIRRQKI